MHPGVWNVLGEKVTKISLSKDLKGSDFKYLWKLLEVPNMMRV